MATNVLHLLTLNNTVYQSYLFWSAVLVLKILAMALLTGIQRFTKHVFANPEDCISKKDKIKFDDPNVERVRRAHLNDLENILPFLITGFLYVLTNPSAFLAINLFRFAAISRILHTIVYAVIVVPQPARFLSFAVTYLATAFMAVQILLYAF